MKIKGFTLIELLAVIVILAIIALIVTPMVLNVIDDVKISSKQKSEKLYLRAVEQAITAYNVKNYGSAFTPDVCFVEIDGNILCNGSINIEVDVKGEKPRQGIIHFENGDIVSQTISFNKSGLYDANNKLIYSWDKLVDEKIITVKLVEGKNTITSSDEKRLKGKLVIDESIVSIGASAFSDCEDLISIEMTSNVLSIGKYAFYNCKSLTNIILSSKITSIEQYTFAYCEKLESIYIPIGVAKIGTCAFCNDVSLASIIIPSSVENLGAQSFQKCTALNNVIIKESEEPQSIKDFVFNKCDNLNSIEIPKSIISIGKYAFADCNNLIDINYKGTKEEWELISFGTMWNKNVPSEFKINYIK